MLPLPEQNRARLLRLAHPRLQPPDRRKVARGLPGRKLDWPDRVVPAPGPRAAALVAEIWPRC